MAVKKSTSDKNPYKKKSSAKSVAKSALSEQNGAGRAETDQKVTVTEYEIRRRAYELYQARGCQHGFDWEDWIRAEAEVLSRHKEGA
jgi:hypothetical protein